MKRASYFISAGAPSADILAAELILTLREKFPNVVGYGLAGPLMRRAAVKGLATMEACSDAGIFKQYPFDGAARIQETVLLESIGRTSPKVAILVGYSEFHKRLAEGLKLRGVPVILYGAPNIASWTAAKIAGLRGYVTKVLGVFPFEMDVFKSNGFDYTFVGSPHKDRAGKVMVSAPTLGFEAGKTVIACLPGSRKSIFTKLFPRMMAVKEILNAQLADVRFVLPLSANLDIRDVLSSSQSQNMLRSLDKEARLGDLAGYEYNGIHIFKGMSLEVMALSHVAMAAAGTTTLECALLGIPHVAIKTERQKASDHGNKIVHGAMINEVASQNIVEEFDYQTDPQAIATAIMRLVENEEARARMISEFKTIKKSLKGFASENAAEIIGQYLGQSRARRRGN